MRSPLPKTPNGAPQSLRLPRGLNYDPYRHAELLGLQVIFKPISKDELVLPRRYATIVVCSELRQVHQRNALAHGIAHWDLAHPDDRPKFELQADRYAALYLIHPVELRDVLRWTDDRALIAQELQVTERLLRAYLTPA